MLWRLPAWVEAESPTTRVRAVMESETGHDPALRRALGDLGVTGRMVEPPAIGGAGLDLLDALDGVFWLAPDGTLRFHALPPPTDAEVARLVATVARRVGKLLARPPAPALSRCISLTSRFARNAALMVESTL